MVSATNCSANKQTLRSGWRHVKMFFVKTNINRKFKVICQELINVPTIKWFVSRTRSQMWRKICLVSISSYRDESINIGMTSICHWNNKQQSQDLIWQCNGAFLFLAITSVFLILCDLWDFLMIRVWSYPLFYCPKMPLFHKVFEITNYLKVNKLLAR